MGILKFSSGQEINLPMVFQGFAPPELLWRAPWYAGCQVSSSAENEEFYEVSKALPYSPETCSRSGDVSAHLSSQTANSSGMFDTVQRSSCWLWWHGCPLSPWHMEGPHLDFCPCFSQSLCHWGNIQMLHSWQESLTLFFLWWLLSYSSWCECAVLAGSLNVKVCENSNFVKKVGCCGEPGGSLRPFS